MKTLFLDFTAMALVPAACLLCGPLSAQPLEQLYPQCRDVRVYDPRCESEDARRWVKREQERERRMRERGEIERRAHPSGNLPSMEQQQQDRESAVRDAYARQRAAPIGRPAGRTAPPASGAAAIR